MIGTFIIKELMQLNHKPGAPQKSKMESPEIIVRLNKYRSLISKLFILDAVEDPVYLSAIC